MQITLDVTDEELDQLAVMAYLAQYVVDSSGKFSTGYKYPKISAYLSMLRKLNKEILLTNPDSKMVEADENSSNIFTHTIETEDACELLKNQFETSGYYDRVCYEISKRDFVEQGGNLEDNTSVISNHFEKIHNNNWEELQEYGLSRFKIIE